MVGAAREPPILQVAKAERQERRLLEFDGVVALRPVVELDQRLGQPRNFERAFAQVVGLLGVQQQNAVGDLDIGHHERHRRPGAELAERGEAVMAVRGPVLALTRPHDDQRIEEAVQPVSERALIHAYGVAT